MQNRLIIMHYKTVLLFMLFLSCRSASCEKRGHLLVVHFKIISEMLLQEVTSTDHFCNRVGITTHHLNVSSSHEHAATPTKLRSWTPTIDLHKQSLLRRYLYWALHCVFHR